MPWLADLASGLVTGVAAALKRPAPPWRYGHGFDPGRGDTMCVYCKDFVPGMVKRTPTPCPGPTHKMTKAELGR